MTAVAVCVILAAASVAFWQMNQGAQAAMVYPHPGLVGWWRCDEGSGTIAGDSSGYGNNGAIYGATWATGKYGKALSFNGNANYVCFPANSLNNFIALTISFWLKTSYSDYKVLFNKWWPTDGSFTIFTVDNKMYFQAHLGGVAYGAYKSFVATGDWVFVTVTWESGSPIKIYINNVSGVDSAVMTGTLSTGAGSYLTMGQNSIYSFNGIIDEVRIYNRALSAAEIQESFQKTPDFSSKLLAKVPKGTTQVIVTSTWQGIETINVTIQSPSKSYTEDMVPVYQKTVYSTSGGTSDMLNIKRLSISVSALSSDENWYVMLEFGDVEDYRITVEVQK
jgi:hypothetical protein